MADPNRITDLSYVFNNISISVVATPDNSEWVEIHDGFYREHGRAPSKREMTALIKERTIEHIREYLQVGRQQYAGALFTVEAI